MAKNIILLSDGTGNSSGRLFRTNVWRAYEALDLTKPDQIAFYDNGVGTSSFAPLRILGGVFGIGLARNVRQIFQFLCENYQPGDRIYCFGFSRGAFTIRILTGLIQQGVVKFEHGDRRLLKTQVAAAYRELRAQFKTVHRLETVVRRAKNTLLRKMRFADVDRYGAGEVKIAFAGLWDTVSAYGLPIEEMTTVWDYLVLPLSFPDQNPAPCLEKACQALSLDDERQTFRPLLWNEEEAGNRLDAAKTRDERISQVWFAGMHSDAGGGYPDDALAHVPLSWMLEEAKAKGLRFKQGALADIARRRNPSAAIHDSRRGLGAFYRYAPRNVGLLSDDRRRGKEFMKLFGKEAERDRVKVCVPKIHQSVFDHIAANPDGYAPKGLPAIYRVVGEGGAIGKPAETRRLAASRVGHSRAVWNKVLVKKVTTLAGIAIALGAVIAPFLAPGYFAAGDSCGGEIRCWLSAVLNFIAGMLPAIVSDVVKAYANAPYTLVAALAAGYAASALGGRTERAMAHAMRAIWNGSLAGTLDKPPRATGLLNWFRRSRRAYSMMTLARILIGLVSVAALLFAGINVAGRILYPVTDAAGLNCWDTLGPLRPKGGRTFTTRSHCTGTGINVDSGKTYEVKLSIEDDWKDWSSAADLRGVADPPPLLKLAGWLKRRPGENWFAPVLRVGASAGSESVVFPAEEEPPDGVRPACREAVHIFTAKATGELKIYVNDAVTAWWPNFYYINNSGTARIDIAEIPANDFPGTVCTGDVPVKAMPQ